MTGNTGESKFLKGVHAHVALFCLLNAAVKVAARPCSLQFVSYLSANARLQTLPTGPPSCAISSRFGMSMHHPGFSQLGAAVHPRENAVIRQSAISVWLHKHTLRTPNCPFEEYPMRLLACLFVIAVFGGCASTGLSTAKTVEPEVASYKTCVMDRSIPMAPSPEPTATIVKDSVERCEGALKAVHRKLMKENETANFAGSFANIYTDNLRKQVISETVAEVDKRRLKK